MSETTPYNLLFSPVQLGPKTARNRLFFTSHGMAMPVQGLIGERYRNYLVERAKGGVGTLVTQSAPVHPASGGSPTTLYLWREEMIPEYIKLSEELHHYDTLGLVMLWHQGHIGSSRYTRQPLQAPSAVAAPGSDELPRELELAEIDDLIEHYARSARFAYDGGMDGVQVQTSADYLLGSFLSPLLNQRQDHYGGSLENRMRIVVQILEAVRRETGPDFIVGIRTTASHLMPDGWDIAEAKEFVKQLAEAGLIDFVDVIVGSYYSGGHLIPAFPLPYSFAADYATQIKAEVTIPVGTTSRIVEPDRAESLLTQGKVDLIGLARPLIADAEWANKARTGRAADIRLCISCNQGCITPTAMGRAGGCILNPAAGYEATLGIGTQTKAAVIKRVLVVGGGPGGLEAARVAAERGHRVTLWEKAQALGGQWRHVAGLDWFREFGNLTNYLIGQVQKLGVKVELGREATAEAILADDYDTVIVATGAIPDRTGLSRNPLRGSPIIGLNQPQVMAGRDVFQQPLVKGGKVVMLDQLGNYESVSTVVALLEQGQAVQVLTLGAGFANRVLEQSWNLGPTYAYLFKQGLEVSPFTAVSEIGSDYVTTRQIYSGAVGRIENISRVVTLLGHLPEDSLAKALKGRVAELHRIGDCLAPRSAQLAIVDGNRVGRAI